MSADVHLEHFMSKCCFTHISSGPVRKIAGGMKPDIPTVRQRHSQDQRHRSASLPIGTHVREFWKLMKQADQAPQTEAEMPAGPVPAFRAGPVPLLRVSTGSDSPQALDGQSSVPGSAEAEPIEVADDGSSR